jgi:hypothetical protein
MPMQRPLPDNTQQSQETDLHALGGIRTRNPSKRGATGIFKGNMHLKSLLLDSSWNSNPGVIDGLIEWVSLCRTNVAFVNVNAGNDGDLEAVVMTL